MRLFGATEKCRADERFVGKQLIRLFNSWVFFVLPYATNTVIGTSGKMATVRTAYNADHLDS
jgi:hypothetical protein